MVRLADRPDMILAVYVDIKQQHSTTTSSACSSPMLRYFNGFVCYSEDLKVTPYSVFVESPSLIHHILYLFCDLFVSYVDSLIGQETVMRNKYFDPQQKRRARVQKTSLSTPSPR